MLCSLFRFSSIYTYNKRNRRDALLKAVNLVSDIKNGLVDVENEDFLELSEKYNIDNENDMNMLLSYLRNERYENVNDNIDEKEVLNNASVTDETNPTAHYIREAKKYPRLSCEEEIECAKMVVNGDKKAKDMLVCSNLWLPIYVAGKYAYSPLEYDDLVQEGNMALLHAIKVFDYTRGFRFSTYAMWHIQQHIKRFRAQNRTISVPVTLMLNYSKIKKASDEIFTRTGRNATEDEIASETGLSIHTVKQTIEHMANGTISLDAPTKASEGNGKETTVGDLIADDREESSPLLLAMKKELGDNLRFAISKLSLREQLIINMRYGLNGHHYLSYSEMAEYTGLSTQTIKKLEKSALDNLRKPTNRRTIHNYMDYL